MPNKPAVTGEEKGFLPPDERFGRCVPLAYQLSEMLNTYWVCMGKQFGRLVIPHFLAMDIYVR